MNKPNNVNANYLKIPKKHCGPQMWSACLRHLTQHKETRSHITLQQVG